MASDDALAPVASASAAMKACRSCGVNVASVYPMTVTGVDVSTDLPIAAGDGGVSGDVGNVRGGIGDVVG